MSVYGWKPFYSSFSRIYWSNIFYEIKQFFQGNTNKTGRLLFRYPPIQEKPVNIKKSSFPIFCKQLSLNKILYACIHGIYGILADSLTKS